MPYSRIETPNLEPPEEEDDFAIEESDFFLDEEDEDVDDMDDDIDIGDLL